MPILNEQSGILQFARRSHESEFQYTKFPAALVRSDCDMLEVIPEKVQSEMFRTTEDVVSRPVAAIKKSSKAMPEKVHLLIDALTADGDEVVSVE
jgi:hypothetical protein